eukprot:SAG31_NODE_4264_length_3397_cov_2.164948_5_plen_187_part_00
MAMLMDRCRHQWANLPHSELCALILATIANHATNITVIGLSTEFDPIRTSTVLSLMRADAQTGVHCGQLYVCHIVAALRLLKSGQSHAEHLRCGSCRNLTLAVQASLLGTACPKVCVSWIESECCSGSNGQSMPVFAGVCDDCMRNGQCSGTAVEGGRVTCVCEDDWAGVDCNECEHLICAAPVNG